jgi:ribosomal 50S subunit-recycling heat shock protein
MRLDLFLKLSRLVSSRNTAQELCDLGLVSVNGSVAKAAKEVKAGDSVTIERRGRRTEVEIARIPVKKQVSKADAPSLYRVVSESTMDDLLT